MNFFKKKKNKNIDLNQLSSIERTMKIQGKYLPGVINNGGRYHYTQLEVYSDGIIDAWGNVDLDFFKKKLVDGWVATRIPFNSEFSIFHLAHVEVSTGKWLFDKTTLYNHVIDIIKSMNPKLENLYDFHGSDVIIKNKIRYAKLGISKGKPYKLEHTNAYFSKKIFSEKKSVFYKINDDECYLCNLHVYKDNSVLIDQIPVPIHLTFEELIELTQKEVVFTEIRAGQTIKIHGFGACKVKEVAYTLDIQSIIGELKDMIATLNNQPNTSDICEKIYQKYLIEPTPQLREELKVAYENIPEHLRSYVLGDMDRKDYPIRQIIYDDE